MSEEVKERMSDGSIIDGLAECGRFGTTNIESLKPANKEFHVSQEWSVLVPLDRARSLSKYRDEFQKAAAGVLGQLCSYAK